MKSDSLSYNTTRQLNYVRDLELIRLFSKKTKTDNDLGIFYRLYVPPKATQYFWPGFYDYSGIIAQDREPGSVHKITAVAYDEAGNKSELRFYLKTPDLGAPASVSYFQNHDTLSIDFVSSTKANKVAVEYRDNPAQAYRTLKCTSTSQPAPDGKFLNHVKLISSGNGREFRFSYNDSPKTCSPWVYFVNTAYQ